MIPLWKAKRELKRLTVQVNAIPLALYEPFLQRRYDQTRSQHIKCTSGKLPASDNLSIFLIYQLDGVPRSVFNTCNHLITSGSTPIIVSNTPLSDPDRVALQAVAHVVAERPNFGYDFGGYRDGLWLINELGLNPQQVIFLNDSVWFPALSTSSLLAEFSTASAEYLGTQIFINPVCGDKTQAMFGSYCFAVNAPLLRNSRFLSFWNNYKLSSNKEVTLRRGERAFSYQMMKSAKNSFGIYSQHRFNLVVESLSPNKLREALGDMIALDPHLETQRLQLLASKELGCWGDEVKILLKDGAKTKNYIGSSPIISIREMGFPMIKKNNERLYKLARQRIMLAVEEGRLDGLNPIILAEMRAQL
jgi:hypothetical protein